MTRVPKRIAALAAAALAAATLAACGKSAGGTASVSSKPVLGGTLNYISDGDVDHLDPLSAYYVPTFILELAYTRQLVSYYASNNYTRSITIAPDVATVVPTQANGGISANGLVYTLHLRRGVDWNTSPPRQVTSYDFLREFKAMCNPVQGVGNPLYYTETIKGMAGYCTAYAAAFKNNTSPTPAQLTAFQDKHAISGIGTPNALTITFTLTQPAYDFLNILAMPFASARPAEYDSYLPDSAQFRQHTLSDGPYAITKYVPLKKIVLSRNPAWKQSTDVIRHQYVSQIVVTEGTPSAQTQLADIQSGTDDLQWDTPPPTSAIASMMTSHNSQLHVYTNTGSEDPYDVLNLQSPDEGHAMASFKVRQAIEYGINKLEIAKIYGGTALNPVLNEAVAPGNAGYTTYDYYPTPNNEGDPAKCRALLTQAGYPHGLTLTDVYRNGSPHPAVFAAVQASLRLCGITLKGVPMTQGPYYDFLENAPNSAKANQWDLSEVGWAPDWLGPDNARSNIVPMFQTDCIAGTTNDGCINNPVIDSDISRALKAPSPAAAAPYWDEAGQEVMKKAYIVPILTQDVVLYAGSRVHNMIYSPLAENWNPTQVWVSG